MSAAIVLFLTTVAGGLAAMAQWARKNRRAEITLYVILLTLSFMAAGVGVFSGLGLITVALGGTLRGAASALYLGAGFVSILGTLTGVLLSLRQILRLGRRPSQRDARVADASDPPVFLTLWFVVLAVSYNVSGLLAHTAAPEELGAVLSGTSGLSPGGVLAGLVPLLLIASLGVGLFLNRDPRAVLARLGYGGVSARHLGVVFVFAVSAYALSLVANVLFAIIQPGLYELVGSIQENMVSIPEVGFVAGIAMSVLVGAALALGEETLLRGALQPVFGIWVIALLSATFGIQYGLGPILVYLFVLSVGLGLLRRRFNTTTSFLAHALYNVLVIGGAYALG